MNQQDLLNISENDFKLYLLDLIVGHIYVDPVAVGQRLGRHSFTDQSNGLDHSHEHLDPVLRLPRLPLLLESGKEVNAHQIIHEMSIFICLLLFISSADGGRHHFGRGRVSNVARMDCSDS